MRVWLGAVVSLGVLAFAACGNDYDSDDPAKNPDGGTKIGTSSSSSGSTILFDSGSGPFAEEEKLPCDGRTASDAFSVFVVPSGADAAGCGTREAPCKTVQAGIAAAYATGKPKVLIGAGTYAEAIALDGGLILEGAWDVTGTTWTASCTSTHSALATIQAPDSANTSVKATRGASVLRFLTFKSKATAAPGESLYGLVAIGPNVKVAIDDSELVVAGGGKGADGAPGTLTGALECATGNDGADGPDGEPGGPSTLGTLDGNGFTPATGGEGQSGTVGRAGTPTAPPSAVSFSYCSSVDNCALKTSSSIGSAGSRGCGGGGGQGGKGGQGGGSSIGILATNAMVVSYSGKITTGPGGAGGNGGAGASGVPGTPGKAGDPMPYNKAPGAGCTGATPPNCGNVQASAPGGEAGGKGGDGGNGGQGGGGAGGWSLGFAKLGNAALLESTTTVFSNGGGGKGGSPNGIEGLGQQQWP
ncbi:MAG: hypothetical protein U0270_04065 [Labilithrix sp.]